MLLISVSSGQNMTRDNFSELSNSRLAVDDDDNEPFPENIYVDTTVDAVAGTCIDRNAIAAEDWGFGGVDKWRTSGGGVFSPAKLKTTDSSSIPRISILGFFFSSIHVITSNLFSYPRQIITLPTGIWTSMIS